MNSQEPDELEEPEGPEPSTLDTIGLFTAIFAEAAFEVAYMTVISPIWLPILVIHKVKETINPTPKPKYRGTVRPLVPINENSKQATKKTP